jgi:RNA polymerase sigma-70 factor (ECF subfamily)
VTSKASDAPAVAPERRAEVDVLYRRYAVAIRRYARRRIGDDAADDVVAQVFSVVLTTGSPIPSAETALPWLYTIARHATTKTRRTSARHIDVAHEWHAAGLASERGPEAHDPAERVTGDALVSAVFADLRDDDAELLRLIVWEDLDIVSAARILGVRPGAARVRLHRIRKLVQRRWPAYHSEPDGRRPERGGTPT